MPKLRGFRPSVSRLLRSRSTGLWPHSRAGLRPLAPGLAGAKQRLPGASEREEGQRVDAWFGLYSPNAVVVKNRFGIILVGREIHHPF